MKAGGEKVEWMNLVTLILAIFFGGVFLGVPLLWMIFRRGNVDVVIYEISPDGKTYTKTKARGRIRQEDSVETLVVYEGLIGTTKVEGSELYREPDGTINLARYQGKLTPLYIDADMERIKAYPVMSKATELAILRSTEKAADRTINKRQGLLAHPAVSLAIVGFIIIAAIAVVTSGLNKAIDANTKAAQSLQQTIQLIYNPPTANASAVHAAGAGSSTSPFTNRKPPA